MTAYYNENDPKAAAWLRELIARNLIAPGIVDDRSIADVRAGDLVGFAQCHFFAGIGVWSYALRAAGWADNREVWTGSCPCQSFSAAGKGAAFDDPRHLWPIWFRLVRECRPDVVFGEQVSAAIRHDWLDLVSTDMEAEGYAIGSSVFGAHSVGAPHQRQRLWWVADAGQAKRNSRSNDGPQPAAERSISTAVIERRGPDGMGDSAGSGCAGGDRPILEERGPGTRCATSGFWSDAEWIDCTDGKARPVEPGTQQMVDGSTTSLGRVCDSCVGEIEREVCAWAIRYQTDITEALRNLWNNLSAQALQEWNTGRSQSIREAPFLLAFLRQLATQGWRFTFGHERASTEASRTALRTVRIVDAFGDSSYQSELAGQLCNESPNALSELSQIVAHYAETCWGVPGWQSTVATGFPLIVNGLARVPRLRGYGNAIVSEAATAFIEAYREVSEGAP